MIIEWRRGLAGFSGNHHYWWVGQPWMQQYRLSATSETVEVTTGTRRQRQIKSLVRSRRRR